MSEYEKKTKVYPRFIGFPIDHIRCQIWCPDCACWHYHSYGEDTLKGWTFRFSHCRNRADASPERKMVRRIGYEIHVIDQKLSEENMKMFNEEVKINYKKNEDIAEEELYRYSIERMF